jgi:benzodiazapine receptor
MQYDKKWYDKLKKSSLTPPSWIFGVVWPILYVLIIASGIIYVMQKPKITYTDKGLLLFVAQFLLNLSWSPLFFTYKQICFSLFVIVCLVILVFLTIQEFYKTSKMASYLLMPYFLWISFATYLNYFVCVNNK